MSLKSFAVVLQVILMGLTVIGCSDEDYRSGQYWLEKENNWQMAVKAFRRSLDKHPNRWKSHKAIIDALGRGNDDLAMETQLRETLSRFPDSTRSPAIANAAVAVLGEERYNRLASSIEQLHLSNLLATGRGGKPELLSRGIMAACRARDTLLVVDYFNRLLSTVKDGSIPDSVEQEMNFFIGPAYVNWLRQDWIISKNPNDIEARLKQLDFGLVMGNDAGVKRRLKELMQLSPQAINNSSLAKRFGLLSGVDPFNSTILAEGWDASFSPDESRIIYIKDLGRPSEPDPYLYAASSSGGGQVPLMKAVQQFLPSIALPQYSPDRQWIYFYGSADKGWTPSKAGRFFLYRVKPTYGARPQKLTESNLLPTPPFFEKNNSILLVKRDVGSLRSSVEIIRINPNTKSTTTISRIGEPVIGATFNAAGDSLILTTDRGVFRRAITGGLISVDLNWRDMQFPRLSQDGRWLILTGSRGQMLAVDRRTALPTWIGFVADPSASFDSRGNLLITRELDRKKRIVRLNLNKEADINPFIQSLQD